MQKNENTAITAHRLNLVGLCGSLRSRSFNRATLDAVAEVLPSHSTLTVADFRDVPVFDADLQEHPLPASVLAIADAMRAADGVLIASPEYNFSIPGGLKNLIDWLSRLTDQPFKGKPVAVMGASMGALGTARMQYELRRVLHCLEAQVLLKPEIFIGQAAGKFDSNGRLTDEPTRQLLRQQMAAFHSQVVQAQRSDVVAR